MAKVLVACEYSGRVRDAFIRRGHDAMSCDILPTDQPGPHYQGDVRDLLRKEEYKVIVAHPPCTFLSNAGVQHLYNKDGSRNEQRWADMSEAAEFFRLFLYADCDHILVENPIMHKYGKALIGASQSQVVQPWMFGHPEQKATCFWLKGLPLIQPTSNVREEMLALPKNQSQRLHYLSPGPERWKLRSTTFQGIADAIADQISDYLDTL